MGSLTENALVLLAAGSIFGLWLWTTEAREMVERVSRRLCDDLRLQRLDDAVALHRLNLARTQNGLAIERRFRFEFSTTGADRCRGEICLHGKLPMWAHLDHPDGAIHIELP